MTDHRKAAVGLHADAAVRSGQIGDPEVHDPVHREFGAVALVQRPQAAPWKALPRSSEMASH
jgi:hypothetical protein